MAGESWPHADGGASACWPGVSRLDTFRLSHGCGARPTAHRDMAPLIDLANLPDADVVALARKGRQEAFRELIRRYERPVFSLIYRMVRDRETAEDLAQDTFIKVLNHVDRYRPEFKLSSWLFKIANNVAIDHLRKRHIETVSIDGSPHAASAAEVEATAFDVVARQESALEELEARELGSAIEGAIAALRPEYRSCILLRHVEGRSYEEIAATLDLPLGTVKTYIHRARHELREALGGERE
jgi:RNA polymerase sigma-70 factor (ECF subfamily)